MTSTLVGKWWYNSVLQHTPQAVIIVCASGFDFFSFSFFVYQMVNAETIILN